MNRLLALLWSLILVAVTAAPASAVVACSRAVAGSAQASIGCKHCLKPSKAPSLRAECCKLQQAPPLAHAAPHADWPELPTPAVVEGSLGAPHSPAAVAVVQQPAPMRLPGRLIPGPERPRPEPASRRSLPLLL